MNKRRTEAQEAGSYTQTVDMRVASVVEGLSIIIDVRGFSILRLRSATVCHSHL